MCFKPKGMEVEIEIDNIIKLDEIQENDSETIDGWYFNVHMKSGHVIQVTSCGHSASDYLDLFNDFLELRILACLD